MKLINVILDNIKNRRVDITFLYIKCRAGDYYGSVKFEFNDIIIIVYEK